MEHKRFHRIAVATVSLVVAAILIVLGRGLIPDREVAAQRDIVAQWLFTWGLIWLTALAAAALSAFLLSAGRARASTPR